MSNEARTAATAQLPAPAAAVGIGKLFVLSGPSGSGKSTVIRKALAPQDLPIRLAVSVTTRNPRPGEKDGVDYYFWSKERFDQAVAAGRFLEWADVYGNRYGTLRDEVDPYLRHGQSVLLEIDVQGGLQILEQYPDCVSIFIRASDQAAYEERLRRRRTDSEESLAKRLEAARREFDIGKARYRTQIVNDRLEAAVDELRRVFRSETGGTHAG